MAAQKLRKTSTVSWKKVNQYILTRIKCASDEPFGPSKSSLSPCQTFFVRVCWHVTLRNDPSGFQIPFSSTNKHLLQKWLSIPVKILLSEAVGMTAGKYVWWHVVVFFFNYTCTCAQFPALVLVIQSVMTWEFRLICWQGLTAAGHVALHAWLAPCTQQLTGPNHALPWRHWGREAFNHRITEQQQQLSNWDVIKGKVTVIVRANWAAEWVMGH